MQKKLLRLGLGILVGILGSIVILFMIYNRDGKKEFSFRKLFSMNTLSHLSRVYDLIMDGIPDEEQSVATNVIRALKSGNSLYEELFQVRRTDKFLKFVEEEGFKITDNHFLMPLITNTKLIDIAKVQANAYDLGSGMYVSSIIFPDGDTIYLSSVMDEDGSEGGGHVRRRKGGSGDENGIVALSPGFNIEAKLALFWEHYKGGVYIHHIDPYEHANFSSRSENLSIDDLNCIDYKFYGKTAKQVNSFSKELAKYRAKGIQRNYLLLGKPGTGKSMFSVEVSRKISNRIVKISSDLFANFDRKDIDFIFNCLRPDSVIIDDFDRVYDDSEDADMLYFFERLKTQYKNITVFCTINNINKLGAAICRPGRFDRIMVFQLPTAQDRKAILESYIEDMDIEIKPTPEELKQLVDITDKFSPAYLKEYVSQLKIEADFKELIRRIKMDKEFIDDTEDFGSDELE